MNLKFDYLFSLINSNSLIICYLCVYNNICDILYSSSIYKTIQPLNSCYKYVKF